MAPELALSLDDVIFLTRFGVEIRYPSDFPDVLPGQDRMAFDLAKLTREAIMAELDPHLARG